MDNKQEYILCAAIKRITPRQDTTMYHNNDICNIEIGYRHHDIIRRFQGEISRYPEDQGFYTSKGRFVDRREAMIIAWKAGQVKSEVALKFTLGDVRDIIERGEKLMDYVNKLYSEDLY